MQSILEVFLGILILLAKTNSKPLPEINSVCSGLHFFNQYLQK